MWENTPRRYRLTLRGYLEQSRQLGSSGESGDLPLDGSALRLQLCALIGAAELLRQTEARKMSHFDETLSKRSQILVRAFHSEAVHVEL